MAFLWSAAGRQEVSTGRFPTFYNAAVSAGAPGLVARCASGQQNIEWASWDAIVGSNGDGSGDLTISVYANPSSKAEVEHLFVQKNDAAGPNYNQAGIIANANSSGEPAAGYIQFILYPSTGVTVAGKVDGNWHLFTGVRQYDSARLYQDGELIGSSFTAALGTILGSTARYVAIGSRGNGTTEAFTRDVEFAGAWNRALSDSEIAELARNHQQLFAPQRRPWIQLGAAAGGAVITESASGRLRAKATETSAPIRTESAVGKRKAHGSVTDTAIHAATVVGRRTARGAATAAPAIRTEAAIGRVTARATTTYTHISAGQITQSIAGRSKARAAVSTTPLRTEAVVARRQARGSDTVTLTRAEAAVGRSKLRAGVTAAPLVAGMITITSVGRLRARGSSAATSALRVEAVASRRNARGTATINGIRDALAVARARLRAVVTGAPYVAPTLPLEVPASSRVLVDKTERLGASPAPRKPPRLG